jgi:nitrous oxidase accessory protein
MTKVFLLLCVSLTFIFPLKAKQIWVKPGKGFPIHKALLLAEPTDTLLISEGNYFEKNLEITKAVTIMGINYPTLSGENRYELISIKSNEVVISGLRLINSGYSDLEDMAAIRIYGNKHVIIRNNILLNNFFGIYLTNASYCLVQNNTITGPEREQNNVGNGIHLWKSRHNFLIGNTIKKHRDGIYFEFVKHSLIARNYSEQNQRYGLHFMFSDSDTYYQNTFMNNGAGVAVMYSQHVQMLKNHFTQNWGSSAYGLLLKDIRDSKVYGNTFFKNTVAIFMDGCSRSLFFKNTFELNGYALRMQASCDDNVFRFNNFLTNTFDYATNGFTVLNQLAFNYWDKYQGYDLEKDGIGDLAFRPMNMLTGVIEEYPTSIILIQSFLSDLLNVLEKVIPSLTPENLKDETPLMKPVS